MRKHWGVTEISNHRIKYGEGQCTEANWVNLGVTAALQQTAAAGWPLSTPIVQNALKLHRVLVAHL